MDAKEEAEDQLEILLKIPKECHDLFDYYKCAEMEWWTEFKIAVLHDTKGHKLFFGDVKVGKHMEYGMAWSQTWHGSEPGMAVSQTRHGSKPDIFFIALLDSEVKNLAVLDFNYFWTYGYIPVWKNEKDALEAVQNHLYGSPPTLGITLPATFPHRPTRPSLPFHPT